MKILYLAAFVFALSGWGMLPYKIFIKQNRTYLERFLIFQAFGFTLTWLFLFLLASLHLLIPTLIHLWIFTGCVFCLLQWRKGTFPGGWWDDLLQTESDSNIRALRILFSSLIVVAYVLFFYFAFAPTTTWDPLDYHYVMPREWFNHGGFVNLPKLMYSNFPASVELIWLTGMALYGEIVANLMTWWFGGLLGMTLLLIGKKYFNSIAGWIGLALFLSLPIVFTEEIPGGVIDLAVFTFNLLCVYFAVRYSEDRNRENLILTILFASNGLSMKHSSLLSLVFAVLIIFYSFIKKKETSRGILTSILVLSVSFVLPLLWYIKSYIYTGNPVYPFLEGVFHPGAKHSIDILYWSNPNFTRNLSDLLTYWYSVITDVSMVQFRFRLINGIYLGLLPLVIWAIRKPGWHRAFISYAFFMIILLMYQAPGEPRYQLAAWALMGIACVYGLFESGIMRDATMRRLIPLALIVPITIMMVMCVHENRNKNGYIWGSDSKKAYYQKNVSVYPLIDYMNTQTADNSLVVWCDPRVYLFEKDYIPAYPFDVPLLPSWHETTETIAMEFQKDGVTHLGFTMAANYRAWVVGVILEQAEIDNIHDGVMYIEDSYAPGYKYEEGKVLDFASNPMDIRARAIGPLSQRALQLASYATHGIEYVKKDDLWQYRVDLNILQSERADDIDVIMIRKLLDLRNKGFLKPVLALQTEGVLFEMNYSKLETTN
jgi:hypothetical protein